MLAIIGSIIVIGCVLGGYVMHHGDVKVLVQVHEYIIIFGAALASMVIGTPINVIKGTVSQAKGVMGKAP